MVVLYNVLVTTLEGELFMVVLTWTAFSIAGYVFFGFAFAVILSTTLWFDAYPGRDPVSTSAAATAQTEWTP